jgi:hypothetical protein
MGTVASNERTSEEASLNNDAPLECYTTPVIPANLIFQLILPFLQGRPTWNAVCSVNKELHEAGMKSMAGNKTQAGTKGGRFEVLPLWFLSGGRNRFVPIPGAYL